MNPLLTKLGVPKEVQDFFKVGGLLFSYGDQLEHYGAGFHRVPATRHIWTAGSEVTHDVIITTSAMEAIAYLTVNIKSYASLDSLSFIAIGNLPQPEQLKWIKTNFPKRKFTLVFGKDLLGRLADIRVAAGLFHKNVRLLVSGSQIQIIFSGRLYSFNQETLSLNAFEKATGLRTGIRTAKPKEYDTFLAQLEYYAGT